MSYYLLHTFWRSPDHHAGRRQLAHFLLALLVWEHVPESECFIARASDDVFAAGRHAQVKHAEGVSGQRLDFLHRRELPQDDLVQAVAVGAHDLLRVLAEHQVAHLATRVHGMQRLQSVRVPEADVAILSAAARCEKASLVG